MKPENEQLKALAEAATKGPWKHYGLDGGHLVFEDAAGSSIASSIGRNHVANARYIAAANPERILALIAENERLAHSRKDAEPVAYQYRMKPEWHDAWVKWQPCDKANFDDYVKAPVVNGWQFDARALFTHPPEADKLLQQALEALETRIFVGPAIAAIRTYLENKNA